MFELSFHICIMKAHVSFPPTPENIILSTQLNGGSDSVFKLHGCTCNYSKIGICCGTVHVSRMGKEIGSAPQKLHSCFFLQRFHNRNSFFESFFNVKNTSIASHYICIVETV